MSKKIDISFSFITIMSGLLDVVTIVGWFFWVFKVDKTSIDPFVSLFISLGWGNALALASISIVEKYITNQRQSIRKGISRAIDSLDIWRKEMDKNGNRAKIQSN